MKKLFVVLCALTLISGVMGTADVYAFGKNITIWDGMGTGTGWRGGPHEDEEVEPGNQTGQIWDLEAFFVKGSELTMVGGFNFKDGVTGNGITFHSGDIFIDVDGDAKYGPTNTGAGGGNISVNNRFGYDYVVDLDFSNMKYDIIGLNSASTVTVYYGQNNESNPWRYDSGGTLISSGGSIDYDSTVSDDTSSGYTGGAHNAVTVNIQPILALSPREIITHFTIECGNDNLMGKYDPVPEPGTLLLLGCGLVGVFVVGRKRFRK